MVILLSVLPLKNPVPPSSNSVIITIHHVRAIDPVDDGSDPADFYWKVMLGGVTKTSLEPWAPNSNEILPNWEESWNLASGSGQSYALSIELWDDDGSTEDDLCDISKRPGINAAMMTYYVDNNSWTGDSRSRYSNDVYHVSGSEDGSTSTDEDDCELWFSITTVTDPPTDVDGDGVADSYDLDPDHDLCIRIRIDEISEIDSTDMPGTIDPYVKVLLGDGSPATDDGDAWKAEIWSHSVIPMVADAPGGTYAGGYYLWKNVPDDRRYVSIQIQVQDDDSYAAGVDDPVPDGKDNSCDDLADISRRAGGGDNGDPDGSTLHLTYDIVTQTWSGDDSSIGGDGSPGFCSGNEDGSTSVEENDASLRFNIETVHEVDWADRTVLAEKFCPILYFSSSEMYYPIDVKAMLDQSNLVADPGGALLSSPPISDQMLADHRLDSRLDQLTDTQASFANAIYANVFTSDNDRIIVQYWFFYLVDYHRLLGFEIRDHEGDWEGITLIFSEDSWDTYQGGGMEALVPECAGYSRHYGGEKMAWSDVQKSGNNPLVFVEEGGHASSFTGSQFVRKTYVPSVMWPNSWVIYAGVWGATTTSDHPSPPGPVYRCSKEGANPSAYMWHEPLYWWTTLTWA